MWGTFKTSLLPSNLSLPTYQLSTHPPMTTSQRILLITNGGQPGTICDHVTFTPNTSGPEYASLLSSSRTLGSDFSNRSAENIPLGIRTLMATLAFTSRVNFNEVVASIRQEPWLRLHGSVDHKSIFEQTRMNPGNLSEAIVWAPYDNAKTSGEGVLIFLSTNDVTVVGLIRSECPDVSISLAFQGYDIPILTSKKSGFGLLRYSGGSQFWCTVGPMRPS
jgi:hypothetical protein